MKRGLTQALVPVSRVLARVRPSDVEEFERTILGSRRVFLTGLGRTGLIARGFAMRLMHLGRRVYHVGDVITPAIRRDRERRLQEGAVSYTHLTLPTN